MGYATGVNEKKDSSSLDDRTGWPLALFASAAEKRRIYLFVKSKSEAELALLESGRREYDSSRDAQQNHEHKRHMPTVTRLFVGNDLKAFTLSSLYVLKVRSAKEGFKFYPRKTFLYVYWAEMLKDRHMPRHFFVFSTLWTKKYFCFVSVFLRGLRDDDGSFETVNAP